MLSSLTVLAAALGAGAASVGLDAFAGDDLSHLVAHDGSLSTPARTVAQVDAHDHDHGDWNRHLFQSSPHFTTHVRESTGLEYDLTYYDTGDANITHGDIMLPLEFTEHLSAHEEQETAHIHMLGVVQTSTRSVWPCPIPYVNNLGVQDPGRVEDAIAHLESLTNWRFVQRTTQSDYLDFVPASGCSSFIGRIGGRQAINLATGCGLASVAHEIMHAMGIFHEQSRPDRDQFVRIIPQNIQPGTENNFDICRSCEAVGEYDFTSVMHYGATAFSVNRQATIEAIGGLPEDVCRMGNFNGLTQGDVASTMERFDPTSGCGASLEPPPYNFDPCTGRTIQPTEATTTQTTTTQATTTQTTTTGTTVPGQTTTATEATTTEATTTTMPVVTEAPGDGTCDISENTAHQGFPYRNAIGQVAFLPSVDGCCDECTNNAQCASWTYLEQGGISYCLLYNTDLSAQAYMNVAGYTSGSTGALLAAATDASADGGGNMPYIAGGVAAASAVVIGGAAAYSRRRRKINGRKSASAVDHSSPTGGAGLNDVQRDVQLAMGQHNAAQRVAGGGRASPGYV